MKQGREIHALRLDAAWVTPMAEKFDEHSGCNQKTPFDSFNGTNKSFRMTARLEDSEE
jgi:hypothetical protein